jgi:nucleoside ABC transporter ATP-binding protein
MAIMRQLKDEGTAIVFITHKLREVRAVADRITVIRLGKVVGEALPTASNAELASMMVGREVDLAISKQPPKLGAEAFVVSDLSVIDGADHYVVSHVSFTVRAGEVLAVAGVQGNGQTELVEAILGLQTRVHGSITSMARSCSARAWAGCSMRASVRSRGPQRRRTDLGVHDRREPHARSLEGRGVRAPRHLCSWKNSTPSPRRR